MSSFGHRDAKNSEGGYSQADMRRVEQDNSENLVVPASNSDFESEESQELPRKVKSGILKNNLKKQNTTHQSEEKH